MISLSWAVFVNNDQSKVLQVTAKLIDRNFMTNSHRMMQYNVPDIRDADAMVHAGQGHSQEVVGHNCGHVSKPKQRMIRKHSL